MVQKKVGIIRRALFGLFALLTTAPLLAMAGQGAASADSFSAGRCTDVNLAVALASGQAANQTVSGTLCTPFVWQGAREVDVMVHGGSYNKTYWRFPIKTALYSYVDDTLLAGRASFAYDKVGAGKSSHPLSTAVTNDGQAFVLHQVLNWLRSKHAFTKFATVGHSIGSATVINEAATYHDEDKVVLTGLAHNLSPTGVTTAAAAQYPANLDPQFSGMNFDSGYLTTRPGMRTIFYDVAAADPDIITYDDAHKDVFSATEFGGGVAQTEAPAGSNVSDKITVPVLIALGQEDLLFCGSDSPVPNCSSEAAVRSFELPFFTGAPSLTVQVTPFTGHDVALHPTSPLSFFRINRWIVAH